MRNIFDSRIMHVLRLLCVAVFLPLSGCQTEDLDAAQKSVVAKGEIELSFTGCADINTRSSLNGVYVNYRKVKDVWVLIFTGVGHSASFLRAENVDWKGDIGRTYKLNPKLEAGIYTLLAVGVDDKAGATYRLPDGIAAGATLRTAQASLAVSAGAAEMAQSDFFVAKAKMTVVPETGNRVSMELRRRESGVQVYLKNIPYTVNYYGYDYRVKTVRVGLYDNQRSSLLLYLDDDENTGTGMEEWTEEDNAAFEEMFPKYAYGFGSLADSETLMEFDMSDYRQASEGNFFEIPARTSPATFANTLYGGAFLLPIEAPGVSNINTLVIELLADPTGGGTGIIIDEPLKTYIVKLRNSRGALVNNYALESNHLYSVGKKLDAESTEGDKPIDISGNIVEVYAADYDLDYGGPVDFPTISTPAYINGVTFNPEKYIFNCVGTTEKFSIDASYPSKSWTLSSPVDWIHFIEKDAAGNFVKYTQELRGIGAAEVTMVINDFVEQRTGYTYEQVDKDIRATEISLKTEGNSEVVTLPVRQYNAITVQTLVTNGSTSYYSPSDYGFNRLDYGCYFDRNTGETVRTEPAVSRLKWGYFLTGDRFQIYGYDFDSDRIMNDGEYAHQKAFEKKLDGAYVGSIFAITRKEAIEWSADGTTNRASGKFWFTPAYHQMQAINGYVSKQLTRFNFLGLMYWTSSAPAVRLDSYVVSMGNTVGTTDPQDRDDYHESRQARSFK